MVFIGIDPGVGGGIAIIDEVGKVVSAARMPETEQDVLDVLKPWPDSRAMLEKVGPMPKQGVVSVFTFGRGYGGLRMALAATGIAFDEVRPAHWQQAMGCRTGGDKNVSKRRAQDLFPYVKVTHAIADALLLAEHARRAERETKAATPERHTCIRDDGGTPNRKCYACEAEREKARTSKKKTKTGLF